MSTDSTGATAAPTRTLRRARWAVLAVFGVHSLVFASWTAHIPQIKATLGLSDAELGVALLGAPAGSVAAMLVTGRLLPRLGSRALITTTAIGYCLLGILIGIAPTLPLLFAALAAWGAFQGALDVSMNTQAVTVERALGVPIMSGLHGGWSIGGFLGALLGTAAVAAGLTLTPQLLVLGPVTLALVLGVARLLLPDTGDSVDTGEPQSPPTPRTLWRPAVLILGGTALASMLAEGAAADWSAVHLRDDLAAGPALAGAGYAAFSATMLAVRLAGNRLLARVPARRLLPALALLAAVGFGLGLLLPGPVAGIAGFAALGIGLALVVPTAFSAAGRLPGTHPGQAIAAVSALGWVGFVLGPPAIGHLASLVGLPVALALLPVLAVVIAVGSRTAAFSQDPAAGSTRRAP